MCPANCFVQKRRSDVSGIGNGKNADCGNTNVPITGHSNNNSNKNNNDHQSASQPVSQPAIGSICSVSFLVLFIFLLNGSVFPPYHCWLCSCRFCFLTCCFAETIHAESFSFIFTLCVMCMLFSLRSHSLFLYIVVRFALCSRYFVAMCMSFNAPASHSDLSLKWNLVHTQKRRKWNGKIAQDRKRINEIENVLQQQWHHNMNDSQYFSRNYRMSLRLLHFVSYNQLHTSHFFSLFILFYSSFRFFLLLFHFLFH